MLRLTTSLLSLLLVLASGPPASSQGPAGGTTPEAGRAGAALKIIEGEWIDFHGWCPNSRCYAYTIVRVENTKKGPRQREVYRFIDVPKAGPARRRAVERRPRELVATPLPRQRDQSQSIRFHLPPTVADGREDDVAQSAEEEPSAPVAGQMASLEFRIVLNDVLGYALVLQQGGRSWAVGAGRYDDIYVDTDAYVFLSPDGEKLALVVYGQVPYRVKGEVHFMRMP